MTIWEYQVAEHPGWICLKEADLCICLSKGFLRPCRHLFMKKITTIRESQKSNKTVRYCARPQRRNQSQKDNFKPQMVALLLWQKRKTKKGRMWVDVRDCAGRGVGGGGRVGQHLEQHSPTTRRAALCHPAIFLSLNSKGCFWETNS